MAKGGTINTYEEARKQRLEENKKRFEDLGISKISKNLTEITSSAKKSGHHVHKLKSKKSNGEVEPRRSSRVRNPVPSYREDVSIHFPALRKRSISSTRGSYTARPLDEIKEATEEERLYALEAAEALQINLNSSNPSFIKSMLWSHVYKGFWLGLPSKFCEEHFPKTVCDMVLEDENGSEYKAVYIGNKSGLSGGWRAFALDHKLDDGDALVFELIEPSRFKMAKRRTNNTYEDARKQRLEENKKRFEDLGILRISKNLTEITSSAKKTRHHVPKLKSKKSNTEVEPRRSSRVRNPVPSYREDVSEYLPSLRKRSRSNSSTWGSYIARPLDEIKEASKEERLCALEAAEELQINLNSSNPSFIKSMVRSHVYSCFWLGLPSKFCEEHLPKTVHDIVLEDENGSEYQTVYIGNRAGLSGGWRAFALDHKLDDGDALVFELIEPSRFKIYIVRAFPSLVEEKGNDILVEEGNKHATKVPKTKCNLESESKTKNKKPRQEKYETSESESSQEHIDKEVKPQGANPLKQTKISKKKTQKKSILLATTDSKGKVQLKTEEPMLSLVLSKKTRKSKGINGIDDSGKLEKKICVHDADSKLEKVEEASKCVVQTARKKSAPKYFRKKA
ncbi:uncharacterized protein LOC106764146 [Vigna radiata var. radiata]|uniref:Uncharacterized protein LOC106764146 n=1 Tax=Vigna radiata var. radiata TaxID=3916 RepID=A0A3Q0F2P4_VIGRR|nr:uncharacterized protein LOC106764146 [Vigna radiata var. radiata]